MLFCSMHQLSIAIVYTIFVNCNSAYKNSQLQQCMKKLSITMVHLKVNNCNNVLLIVMSPIVNTKVIDQNSNYKSFQKQHCIRKLQISLVHKKVLHCNIAKEVCKLQQQAQKGRIQTLYAFTFICKFFSNGHLSRILASLFKETIKGNQRRSCWWRYILFGSPFGTKHCSDLSSLLASTSFPTHSIFLCFGKER